MIELARNYGKGPINILWIATKERISINYLEQLFSTLRKSGIVKSRKGPGGGYYLAKAPKDILFWDVFKILEGEPYLVKCLGSDENPCMKVFDCVARVFWTKLAIHIKGFFENITLQDIIDEEKNLPVKRTKKVSRLNKKKK